MSSGGRDAIQAPALGMAGRPLLQFQPAVDLSSGLLLGFEALLRWEHPERGLIPPSVVIPWAEANGHIDALNAWVLDEACRQAAGWPSGIQLAVNCSLVQLRHRQASVATKRALARTGLNPDRLTIEVTESAVADESCHGDLRSLVKLGVHLAVDDVGTSWSTLENFRRFSIDTAKIDRIFIAALEPDEGMHRAIVEAIVQVSRSLGLSTVAEGVETAQQVALLRDFGVDVAQGYFFAPPLSSGTTSSLAGADPRPVFALTADDGTGQTLSELASGRA
ncbi:MAG TPA: EAL domain-containing protein [Acidimicrobiales bacterium]|nr:EAL domain-containing protein [Acidimicrobiales bacterium]